MHEKLSCLSFAVQNMRILAVQPYYGRCISGWTRAIGTSGQILINFVVRDYNYLFYLYKALIMCARVLNLNLQHGCMFKMK